MEDVTGRRPRLRPLPFVPPAILYLAICVQSGFAVALPLVHFRWGDKVLHFTVFGLLGLLTARALDRGTDAIRSSRVLLAIVALVMALLGACDEVHQYFVPGRRADVLDWVADLAGGVSGAFAWSLLATRLRR